MRLRNRRLAGRPLAVAFAVTLVVTGGTAHASQAEPSGDLTMQPVHNAPVDVDDGTTDVVTLLTGDRVELTQYADGRYSTVVDPAPRAGGELIFDSFIRDEQVYVVPSDAAALVPQTLDQELFNVSKLAEYGYHDGVPVVIAQDETPAAGALAAAPGMTTAAPIAGLGMVPANIDSSGQWWQQIRPDAGTMLAASSAKAVPQVWLDEQLTVTLEDSVPQIGAPQAWDFGYDGTGMTVAVLDTGVDVDHPDLVGQIAASENFTQDEDAGDEHGHGTHVAGTVAGTGAASDGQRVGVAPGAQVLNGKVCNAAGSCPVSAMLDGMQWAASSGADVVNMSIGGGVTDGTDPLSEAVNALTDEYGTLFVVSAGNSGPRDRTLTRPATADAALAVGAVNKQDALASFSSRGPRLGDFALKPEVTAPGVAIVAPRGAGTDMGTPDGDYYTSAQGTSMAAPHVAGAAALVLQQQPDLTWDEVRTTLTNTAVPADDLDVYQQGGGRIDVMAALSAPVRAEPGVIDFGHFEFPQDDLDPVEIDVAYTNTSEAELTLDLSLTMSNRDGTVLDDGQVWLSSDEMTLATGEQGQVTVTVAPALVEHGWYGGYLSAEADGETVLRHPVGFIHEEEMYDLHLEVIDRHGYPAGHHLTMVDIVDVYNVDTSGEDGFFELSVEPNVEGHGIVRVPVGTYSLVARVPTSETPEDPINSRATDFVLVAEPEVEVDQDTTVVFDAQSASKVTIDTPDHPEAEQIEGMGSTFGWGRQGEESGEFGRIWTAGSRPVYATPTEPVTLGDFEFESRWRIGDPEAENLPYLYDLVLVEPGHIGQELHYEVRTEDMVTIDTAFHGDLPGHDLGEVRANWRPWRVNSSEALNRLPAASERTDYLMPGETTYRQRVYGDAPFAASLQQPHMVYPSAEHRTYSWFEGPSRPGLQWPDGQVAAQHVHRTGDSVFVRMQEWSDASSNYGTSQGTIDTTSFRAYEDGELVHESNRPSATIVFGSEPATLQFELELARDAEWWSTSTELTSVWTFGSEHTDRQEALPLLFVDYQAHLGLDNTAPQPGDRRDPDTVDLQVAHQPQVQDPAVIAGARVWVSFDDGDTWQERPVHNQGEGGFQAVLPQRATGETSGYVSLRAEVWDVDGNQVEQEITRAWQLAPR